MSFPVTLKLLSGGDLQLDASAELSVGLFRLDASQRLDGAPEPDRIRLIYNGRVLEDNYSLGHYNIRGACSIHVVVRAIDVAPSQPSQPAAAATAGARNNNAPQFTMSHGPVTLDGLSGFGEIIQNITGSMGPNSLVGVGVGVGSAPTQNQASAHPTQTQGQRPAPSFQVPGAANSAQQQQPHRQHQHIRIALDPMFPSNVEHGLAAMRGVRTFLPEDITAPPLNNLETFDPHQRPVEALSILLADLNCNFNSMHLPILQLSNRMRDPEFGAGTPADRVERSATINRTQNLLNQIAKSCMIASQALAGIKFEPLSPGMSGPPSMPNAVYPPVHAANGVNPMNPLAQQQGMNPLLANGFPPMPVPLASAGLPPSHPHHLPFAFGGAGPQAFAPYGAAANPFAPGHPNPNVVLRPSSAAPGGTGAAAAAGGLAGAFKQAKKKPATANGKKENDKESKTKETRTKKSKDKSTKEESDDIYDDMPGLTSLVSSSHDPATANEKEKVSASQSQQEGKSEGSKSSAPSSSSSTVTVDTRKKEKSSDADKKTPVPKAKEDKADCKQS